MKGEIITVGNELLAGLVVDTNSSYIAGRLMTVGVRVSFMTTVEDDEGAVEDAVRRAQGRAEVIVITGGLGPTPDDITSRGVAKALGKTLVLSPEAQRQIRDRYERRGMRLPADADRQALIPRGARIVANPAGTAPGYYVAVKGKRIFVVPGVPEEMRVMTDQGIVPILEGEGEQGFFITRKVLRIFGLTESEVHERVKDVPIDRGLVTIGFLPIFPENHLTITAESTVSNDDAKGIAGRAEEAMRGVLGASVFGTDDQTLEAVVGGMLITRGMTVAAAESCTGGLLSQRLTATAGSSAYFLRGVVTYSDRSKSDLLGIKPELISAHGAVSGEVAEAMATGIKKGSGADIGISITGIAGPSGGTREKPVGTVFIGVAHGEDGKVSVRSQGYRFFGDRNRIRLISSEMALEWVRRLLMAGPARDIEREATPWRI